jgi:hypothetical protein
LIFLSQLSWANVPYTDFLHSFHVPNLMSIFFSLGHLCRESVQFQSPLWHLVTSSILRWVISPMPNPKAGEPPLVGYLWLFIQYIRSYPPYLEAISSIWNLRTRHAVVTRDSSNMEEYPIPFLTLWHIKYVYLLYSQFSM